MTREEAIDVLKHNYPSDCFTDLCEAVEIAIQALSAQPEIIRCKDCRHANECHKSVQYTRNEPYTVTIGYSPIEWCSRGEEKGAKMNGGSRMSDLIDRQAAIDAMATALWHYPNECYRNLNEYEFAKGLAELGLKSVPSAQPEIEERKEESAQNVPNGELISRKAAIDALCTPHGILYPIRTIEELPSAQPETAKRIVVKSRYSMTLWYQCDMCNEPVDVQDNYCRGCGRRLTDG